MRIERAFAAAVLLGASACAAPRAAAKAKAARTEAKAMSAMEWKGQYGGPQDAGHRVVTDAKAWEALWAGAGKPAPAVDFAKDAVVVVDAGQKPTGGWGIRFADGEAKGDDLLVRVEIVKPTGFATMAFTQPWAARAYPRPKGEIVVEVVSE
jgi:hypothetical protein